MANLETDYETAAQLVKSDAEANDRHELAAELRAGLAEINARFEAEGFAPVA